MRKVHMPLMTIDPGVEFGWAVWPEWTPMPEVADIYIPAPNLEWELRIGLVLNKYAVLLEAWRPRMVLMEMPHYMEEAAARSGSLVKLAYVAGMFQGATKGHFQTVEVRRWKGQLPKAVVQKRIRAVLGSDFHVQSHAWDAVGLGLWYMGLINAEQR